MRQATILLLIGVFLSAITIPSTVNGQLKQRIIKQTTPTPSRQPVQQTPQIPVERAKMNPIIESLLSVPLGALRPLTRLYVNGKYFGKQPGKIILYREGGYSPVELINVNWVSEEKINGVVPELTKTWPNQTVTIKVKSTDNRVSNPMKVLFAAREEKWLVREDVFVEHCGSDGNYNRCNHVRSGGGSCGDQLEGRYQSGQMNSFVVIGFHCNNWGAAGNDVGRDRYLIRLKNGWVFKSWSGPLNRHSSEAFVEGPIPSFPLGKSEWRFEYSWSATPADGLTYRIEKISVEGPVETNYK